MRVLQLAPGGTYNFAILTCVSSHTGGRTRTNTQEIPAPTAAGVYTSLPGRGLNSVCPVTLVPDNTN